MKNSNVSRWAAWAGIISAAIAIASLILQVTKPDIKIYQVIQQNFPWHTFFLFIFAFIAITYYLSNNLAKRIGDINIDLRGDVITTSHIGEYIEKNIQGIDAKQLEQIIDAISKKSDLKSTVEKLADSLDDKDLRDFIERIVDKKPEVITSEHITKIIEKADKRNT